MCVRRAGRNPASVKSASSPGWWLADEGGACFSWSGLDIPIAERGRCSRSNDRCLLFFGWRGAVTSQFGWMSCSSSAPTLDFVSGSTSHVFDISADVWGMSRKARTDGQVYVRCSSCCLRLGLKLRLRLAWATSDRRRRIGWLAEWAQSSGSIKFGWREVLGLPHIYTPTYTYVPAYMLLHNIQHRHSIKARY